MDINKDNLNAALLQVVSSFCDVASVPMPHFAQRKIAHEATETLIEVGEKLEAHRRQARLDRFAEAALGGLLSGAYFSIDGDDARNRFVETAYDLAERAERHRAAIIEGESTP